MKKLLLIVLFFGLQFLSAQSNFDEKLVGEHMISLQWISWDYFGKAMVTKTENPNEYTINGAQKSKENADYLKIDGTLKVISLNELVFTGIIETSVSFINDGEACKRNGIFKFKAKGKRKYWRLDNINNPCDQVADYVDIYFKQ